MSFSRIRFIAFGHVKPIFEPYDMVHMGTLTMILIPMGPILDSSNDWTYIHLPQMRRKMNIDKNVMTWTNLKLKIQVIKDRPYI